jgi:hypothetical protein
LLLLSPLLLFPFHLVLQTLITELVDKYLAPRTIEYQFDRIADTVNFVIHNLHFVVDALNPVIDSCYFVVDPVRKLQELCGCHPYFVLCQFIQPLECVFDIRPPQQLLQIFF